MYLKAARFLTALVVIRPCATFLSTEQHHSIPRINQKSKTEEYHGRIHVRLSSDGGQTGDESVDDAADAERIAQFRAKLMAGGLDSVVTLDSAQSEGSKEETMWARRAEQINRGCVLVGVESFFFGSKGDRRLRQAALQRVGLPHDIAERVPEDRRRTLMPVVLVLEHGTDGSGSGVLMGRFRSPVPLMSGTIPNLLLGRRSGFIMGDFKQLDPSHFLVQPLWVGGPSSPPRGELSNLRTVGGSEDNEVTGILAVHPYPNLDNAIRLTEDGLYCGGDWTVAKDMVARGRANPFRFRLLAQTTQWRPGDLNRELAAGAWTIAHVSTELLLKDRQPGSRPLWLDINDQLESL